MTVNDVLKIINPLKQRMMNFLSRGVVRDTDDSKGIQRIKSSLMADEVQDNMERFQNYGFTSCPLDGAESLAIFHSGNRDHGIIIAIDDRRFRIKGMEKGEVALYTDEGDFIQFKRGRKIEVETKNLTVNAADEVNIETKDVVINCLSAKITSPQVEIISSEKVSVITPLMEVSGLIQCAGIGAGAAPEAGKAKVAGSVEATGDIESQGQVKDSIGTISEVRSKYNAHKHNVSTDPTPTPTM